MSRSPFVCAVAISLAACNASDPGPAANLGDDAPRELDVAAPADHPLNAQVTRGRALCPGFPCRVPLPGGEQIGELVATLRLRVLARPTAGEIAGIAIFGDDAVLASTALTVEQLGHDVVELPLRWPTSHAPVELSVVVAPGAAIELEDVAVFPAHFGIAIAPGSGVYADTDLLTIELGRDGTLDAVVADGVDISSRLGAASIATTSYRTVYTIAIGDLLPDRGEVTALALRGGIDAARVQIRRAPPSCDYAGHGQKVLVTGFEPLHADPLHDNVSGVAVAALDPARIPGAAIMKLVLPVEYDRAAAELADAIARCAPDLVISFGQGDDTIAVEHVAYNLQDLSWGGPDNRGLIRSRVPIDPAAGDTRETQLSVDALRDALVAIGEDAIDSTDPGRYVCNNVFFVALGAMAGRAGFIHLPATVTFDDATRARFARVAETAIRAAL